MSYKLFAAGLLATVGVIGTISAPAQAASLGNCSVSNVTAEGMDATACAGSNQFEEDNDTNKFKKGENKGEYIFVSELNDLFGSLDSWDNTWEWDLSGKSDGDGGEFGFTAQNNLLDGNWSLSQAIEGPFIITLKAAKGFNAYFFEDLETAVKNGEFNTQSLTNGGGNQAALSHASVWTIKDYDYDTDTPDTPQEVPEPGTLLGFLTLGGVVFGKKAMGRKS